MSGAKREAFMPKASVFRETFELDPGGLPIFKVYAPSSGWVTGRGGVRDDVSPIDGSIIAKYHVMDSEQALGELGELHSSGRWDVRNTPGERRLKILEKTADLLVKYSDDLVEALVLDAGKTYELARGEVKASIDRLEKALLDLRRFSGDYIPGDWDAHTLETEGLVRREPYGVVACITPFNYPLYDSVMKVVASFVTANAIILKPSLHDPIAPILFARLLLEAGFPPRALMLAVMEGEEFSKVLPDKRIGAVLLTGSSETGRRVLATAGVKSYLLELGGGDPAIVLGDADLESAARDIVTGIISYSGQRCDAIKIVLVESQVYDIMRRLLVSELERRVRVGDPRDPSVTVGPLISVQAVDKMEAAIRDALEKGGRLLFGGKRLGPTYIEPALIEAPADKVQEMELYRREVFAPVALLVEVTDLDHALRLANGRPYGLDACIFSKNLDYVRRAARYLEVGAVYVNMFPRHGIGYYPYGGRKESGVGVEGIGYSIEYTSAYKSIVFNYKGARIWDYVL